jgi:hypothetical protein
MQNDAFARQSYLVDEHIEMRSILMGGFVLRSQTLGDGVQFEVGDFSRIENEDRLDVEVNHVQYTKE